MKLDKVSNTMFGSSKLTPPVLDWWAKENKFVWCPGQVASSCKLRFSYGDNVYFCYWYAPKKQNFGALGDPLYLLLRKNEERLSVTGLMIIAEFQVEGIKLKEEWGVQQTTQHTVFGYLEEYCFDESDLTPVG